MDLNGEFPLILGFGLAGYRSFGPDLQRIGPCRKINLIIGQNNCSKSNILRFIQEQYRQVPKLTRTSVWPLRDLEKFRTTRPFEPSATVALSLATEDESKWIEVDQNYRPQLETLFNSFGRNIHAV